MLVRKELSNLQLNLMDLEMKSLNLHLLMIWYQINKQSKPNLKLMKESLFHKENSLTSLQLRSTLKSKLMDRLADFTKTDVLNITHLVNMKENLHVNWNYNSGVKNKLITLILIQLIKLQILLLHSSLKKLIKEHISPIHGLLKKMIKRDHSSLN